MLAHLNRSPPRPSLADYVFDLGGGLSPQQSRSGTPVAAVIAPVATVIAAVLAAVMTPHGAK